jgi:cytochrome oxidase Cu insertion factor (SCO1/SenC/PrrC family)
MTVTSNNQSPQKVRRVFFSLLLLFMVPLLLASWMALKHKSLPHHTTNKGQLLQPPLDITQLKLAKEQKIELGRWLLLYVNPTTACDKQCEKALYNIRQIRTATGKDINRVQRVILTFSDAPTDTPLEKMLYTEFSGTLHVIASKQLFTEFVQNSVSQKTVLQTGGIYVVDPLGNIMMFYSLESDPMGIFKDMTKLLKLSNIG